MKILKKILRIITILLPCLVSCFISHDSFASGYNIDSFSAYMPSAYWDSTTAFSLTSPIRVYLTDTTNVHYRPIPYLLSNLDTTSGKCVYYDFVNQPQIGTNSITWAQSYLAPDSINLNNISPLSNYNCRIAAPYNSVIGGYTTKEFQFSSVPQGHRIDVASLYSPDSHHTQYNYMYSKIPFYGSREDEGFILHHTFYVSDLLNVESDNQCRQSFDEDCDYNYYADKISGFELPLNYNSYLDDVAPGEHIYISTVLDPAVGSYFKYNLHFYILSVFVDPIYRESTEVTTECFSNTGVWEFMCDIEVPQSLSGPTLAYGFTLRVRSTNDTNWVFTPLYSGTDEAAISFRTFTICTNSDCTYVGSGEFPSTGSYPNVSPGVPDGIDDNVDWVSSLTSWIASSLNFLNPFAPFFDLFTNRNTCVDIPIIADMIHSPESHLCPIFPQSVYSITTPVFGIFLYILLFGYAIKFLRDDEVNVNVRSIDGRRK